MGPTCETSSYESTAVGAKYEVDSYLNAINAQHITIHDPAGTPEGQFIYQFHL